MFRTMRKRDFPAIIFGQALAAWSSGTVSIMADTPLDNGELHIAPVL
jgi:hypothetical protein